MKRGKIRESWTSQSQVGNGAGKHRPLPVGTRGMSCGFGLPENNPLLRNGVNKPKAKVPKRYTFEDWCDLPEGVDRISLLLMEDKVSSAHARAEAKSWGGGKKCAMKFWFAMLVTGGWIDEEDCRYYYQRFKAAMTTDKYPTMKP